MKTPKVHILLCDDDVNATTVVADYLRAKGYQVVTALDGEEALAKLKGNRFDICLLDENMPKMDGLEVLSYLRRTGNTMPIVMMFESNSLPNILRAYEMECDDYVVKPLSVELMIGKMEAILRRVQGTSISKETQFELDGLHFDSLHQTLGGKHLSARENDLLLLLCQRMNELVDRHLILRTLWQSDDNFAVRSLSVYVNHLRHMLEGTDIQILPIHGRGYKLVNSKSS